MTKVSDMLYHLGGLPVGLGLPFSKDSKYYFATGAGSTTGSGALDDPCDLASAYGKCVAGQHDTVIYIASSSGMTLSAALVWAKDYTHLIGIAAPTAIGVRSRIFQLSTLTAASPFITVSGSGCIFKNFYAFQGVADATSLINVSVTGGRNYFEGVHFAGGGHADQAINGGASLKLDGAEENLFVRCTVGVDTIAAATGMVNLLFDGQAHRNTFVDCKFLIYAGHIDCAFVEVVDGTGIDRWNSFENCKFINSNLDNFTIATAFLIPAFAGNNSSRLLMDSQCSVLGATVLDTNDRGVLYGNLNAITGADLSGVSVELKT